MRCVNCGWDNKNPNTTNCEKCGHPLVSDGSQQSDPYSGVNVPNSNDPGALGKTVVSSSLPPERAPRPTRLEGRPAPEPEKQTRLQTSNLEEQDKPTRLQAASFEEPQPITPQAAPIPQQAPVQQAPQAAPNPQAAPQPTVRGTVEPSVSKDAVTICDVCHQEVPADYMFCPNCGARIRQKTIFVRPNREKAKKEEILPPPPPPQPKFLLTLIPEPEEAIEATTQNYEGESVILNRDNTEPDNLTITSRQQAELTCQDGKWFIEDHSDHKSTFIVANRKFEIQSGDIIVLGDRRFKFETEK